MSTKYNGVQVPEGTDAADGPKAFRDAVDAGNFVPLFNTEAERDAWAAPNGALAGTLTPPPGGLWRRENNAWVAYTSQPTQDARNDARYVNVNGDTMTGPLVVPGATVAATGAGTSTSLEVGRTDVGASTHNPLVDFHTGFANDYDVRLHGKGGTNGTSGAGYLDVYGTDLRLLDPTKSNRVTDIATSVVRRYATTAAMVADQANVPVGQKAVTVDSGTTFTRTATGWAPDYTIYANGTERDLAGTPPDGALCYQEDTDYTYWAKGGVWTPANALFVKRAGNNHAAFTNQAAALGVGFTIATVATVIPAGTAVSMKVWASQIFTLSGAALGDEWQFTISVEGVAKRSTRWYPPRTGAQPGAVDLAWHWTHTAVAANPPVTLSVMRLVGSSTISGAADGVLNNTTVEYSAAFPF